MTGAGAAGADRAGEAEGARPHASRAAAAAAGSHDPLRRSISGAGGSELLDANRADLLEVGDPLQDLHDSVLEQRRHPVGHGLLAQVLDGGALLDLALDLVGGHQELVDAHAPLVPGVAALGAALRAIEGEV